jgi:ferrous iron transport protein B
MLINVVDASNLERNLYLTLQLLELGIPCIVALNMLDIAEKQKLRIDVDALSARLGCPVVPLVSTRGRGIDALKLAIDRHREHDVELVHYPQPLLREADLLAQEMATDAAKTALLAGPADAGRRYLQPRLCRHAADKLDMHWRI